MPTPSDETKPIARRLTPSQRTLRVLVCMFIVVSALPLSMSPAGAEFTSEEWRVDLSSVGQAVHDVDYAKGLVIVHMNGGAINPQDSRLLALDAQTGAEVWNVSSWNAPIEDSVAIIPSEDAVYTVGNNSHGAFKYDLQSGDFLNNGTGQSTRYETIEANRNDSRLYAVRGNDVVELNTGRPTEAAQITAGNSPDRITVSQDTGRVFVEGTGIEAYNEELTTLEWSISIGGPLDWSNGFVYTDSHKIDESDGSNISGGAGDTVSVTAPENATTLYTGQGTGSGNITEWNQGDYTEVDTIDITPNDEAGINNIATDDTKNEVIVFASTRNEVIVRHDTDSITTEGDENLDLDVPGFMEHGDVEDYEVTATFYNETQEEFVTVDATEDANVTSLNTSLLTVDENRTRVVATTDESLNGVVEVRAEYENLSTTEEVVIAEIDIEHIDILPPVHRFAATLSDETMLIVLLATLAGASVTVIATVFAGLVGFWGVIAIGWIIGMVGDGLLLVSIFLVGFIGLNVAGNIDYDVRR